MKVGTVSLLTPAAIHPVDKQKFVKDIGLIWLKQPLAFGPSVQPLPISTERVGEGVGATLTGWGYTTYPGELSDVLQYLEVTTTNFTYCVTGTREYNVTVRADVFCAKGDFGRGSCYGDCGGSLIADGQLIGVAISGKCNQQGPDVFADLYYYLDWIEGHISL